MSPTPGPAMATRSRAQQLAVAADTDPVGPLWRAAQVFRVLSYLYALGFQLAINDDLEHGDVAWVLFGVLTVTTAASAVAYWVGFGRNRYWVGAEVVVVCALMLSTSYVADTSWALANQSWPTTLWATNAVISAAILGGAVWGVVVGLIVSATSVYVKTVISLDFGRNAAIIIIVSTGMAVGMAAAIARRASETLRQAAHLAAATEERERLSREVHDGVLQVLALVSKRGREIGGPTTELADLAGVQERRLRALISETGSDIDVEAGTSDLVGMIRGAAGEGVSVSAPGERVLLPSRSASEIVAAVRNALDNTRRHAGDGASAFVLIEDTGEAVVVSVRDDGVGIADGRLAEAERQGRMGVSKSIVGRIESIGGTAALDSEPDGGTEWEFTIPTAGEAR